MIKIISSLHYRLIDDERSCWKIMPLIPASARYSRSDKVTDDGTVAEIEITARISRRVPDLSKRLRVGVEFDSNEFIHLGTEFFPVSFSVSAGDIVEISTKYVVPAEVLDVL